MTTRRSLLKLLSASPAIGLGATLPTALQAQATAVGLLTGNVCTLMPEVTEGPYYIDPGLVRADIREDRTGIALDLRLQVVSADCQPIEGARVDIWHCDAQGNYSGFAGQGSDTTSDTAGQTFLRGTQMTDAAGLTAFRTIYPGWYRGRTTHIHFKVFLDDRTVLTGQIFFPDALSQYLYDNAPDYAREGSRDTINRNDNIAAEAGPGAHAHIREQPEGYQAALVIGVDPESEPTRSGAAGGPPPGDGTPPGPPPADSSASTAPEDLIPGLG